MIIAGATQITDGSGMNRSVDFTLAAVALALLAGYFIAPGLDPFWKIAGITAAIGAFVIARHR